MTDIHNQNMFENYVTIHDVIHFNYEEKMNKDMYEHVQIDK